MAYTIATQTYVKWNIYSVYQAIPGPDRVKSIVGNLFLLLNLSFKENPTAVELAAI